MPLKVIKTLNENSTKCYGPNRIIIGSFQHGFIELAHKGNFCGIFLKPAIKTDVSFFTTLSKYKLAFVIFLGKRSHEDIQKD